MNINLPAHQFYFRYIGFMGFTQVVNAWNGYRSDPVMMDDFGNGIELCNSHVGQWNYSLT